MDKNKIKELEEQGYELFYDCDGDFDEDYQIIDLDENFLKNYFNLTIDFDILYEKTTFIKRHEKYHITIDDLIDLLNNIVNNKKTYNKFCRMYNYVIRFDENHLDSYENIGKNLVDKYDFYLENDDSLIHFILYSLFYDTLVKDFEEEANHYINIIQELVELRKVSIENRKYSNDTLALLITNIGSMINESVFVDEEIVNYYRTNLKYLADNNVYEGVKMLAYEYYEGSQAFDIDYFKARDLFIKAYEMKQDPYVANTLGYLYYYGRCNNGVCEGDLAFKYFSVASNARGIFEATYKLADCYIHGYGGIVSHEAAFRLVNELHDETLNHLLDGEFKSKYADVALRLGNYYKNGIFVNKDLDKSYRYYLEALMSIKKRLIGSEYIGDKGVAFNLFKNVKEFDLLMDYNRDIIDNGYVIHAITNNENILYNENGLGSKGKYEDVRFEYINGDVHIMSDKEEGYWLIYFNELKYCEISNTLHFVFKNTNLDSDAVNILNDTKYHTVYIEDNKVTITDGEYGYNFEFSYENMLFIPSAIKKLDKSYKVCKCVDGKKKTHYYLCNDENVKIGDEVKNQILWKYIVEDIYYCYEDRLPLPLDKMGIVKKSK